MSYDDAAAILTAVTGRSVRHHSVSTDQHIDFLTDAGYDPEFAALLAALDDRVRSGAESAVTGTVEKLTRRAPRSFRDFVAAQAGVRT